MLRHLLTTPNRRRIMKEIWKKAIYIKRDGAIVDFGDWYEVSNLGRVRSYREHGGSTKKDVRCSTPKLLKSTLSNIGGYYRVHMKINGQSKSYLLHRLVLSSFVEIPEYLKGEKYIDVNHIDENKDNNVLENLVWCTRLENNLHGTRLERAINKGNKTRNSKEWRITNSGGNVHNARKVVGVNTKTGEVVDFDSMTGVVDFFGIKLADRSVSATIRGKQKTAYGYKWYYKEDYENKGK